MTAMQVGRVRPCVRPVRAIRRSLAGDGFRNWRAAPRRFVQSCWPAPRPRVCAPRGRRAKAAWRRLFFAGGVSSSRRRRPTAIGGSGRPPWRCARAAACRRSRFVWAPQAASSRPEPRQPDAVVAGLVARRHLRRSTRDLGHAVSRRVQLGHPAALDAWIRGLGRFRNNLRNAPVPSRSCALLQSSLRS